MNFLAAPFATWTSLDTWIVVTAALTAMSCAVPGCFLVLRRQSLMGDALSHAVLPGIVLAYMAWNYGRHVGWLSNTDDATRQLVLFFGAAVTGVLCALLTEAVRDLGRVEAGAALGVVFTSLFALGLLLVRLFADQAHVDPGCVLYGNLEMVVAVPFGRTGIPVAAATAGAVCLINLLLTAVFFKELQLSSFDPALATSLGIPARLMNYGLMAVTSATVVTAFETVGSVLVLSMLVVPAATALLLTDRLRTVLGLSLIAATASAVLGHAFSRLLPWLESRVLGMQHAPDASTSGLMAVAGGLLFLMAWIFGPRYGALRAWRDRRRLLRRIIREDLLGRLYRQEEPQPVSLGLTIPDFEIDTAHSNAAIRAAVERLVRDGLITAHDADYRLTESGRRAAVEVVRSHRLWESYLAREIQVGAQHVHASAEEVEHLLDEQLKAELAAQLDHPAEDPHGKAIPGRSA
jgi:manganese/zinc/iron transport system permease protein